jgi:hypothetical protein
MDKLLTLSFINLEKYKLENRGKEDKLANSEGQVFYRLTDLPAPPLIERVFSSVFLQCYA